MTQPPSVITPAARPRRRSIWAVFAIAGALVVAGAAAPAFAEVVGSGPGAITGTVSDTNGQPVQGVTVNVSSAFSDGYATTDAAGFYELSGLTLDDESYINVFAPGYQQVDSSTVTLTAESPSIELNFTITPFSTGTGIINGHVTVDGAPLAGADVSAFEQSTFQTANTVTDDSGYYELTGLPNGQWQIWVFAGDQYQTLNTPTAVITDQAQVVTIDAPFISYPSGTASISGVVTDSVNGEPVADVNVSLSEVDVPVNRSLTTDAEGHFSFDSLPAGTFYVSFSAAGYLDTGREVTVAADQNLVTDQVLIVRNSSVSGHLQLANGTPVAGAFVGAQSVAGSDSNYGVSDENGDYVITDLGAVAYTIRIGGWGTAYDTQETVVTANADGPVIVNFTLVPRTTGSFMGTVFQPSGEPYTRPICATLYSAKKKAIEEHYIDGDHYGSDEFWFYDLKPGKYTVEIRDCDDDPATKFDKVFLGGVKNFKDATFVTVVAGEDGWGNDIVFAPRAH